MKCLARAALVGIFSLGCQSDPPLEVATVELSRMQGTWFEIASLPRRSQAGCIGTTAEYQLVKPTELRVINECHEGSAKGPVKRAVARAVATDAAVPAKLSLDFGVAYGDYWIIDVAEDYSYLVVGHPTRDYLWILSRERHLPAQTLDGILQRSRALGFPVGILKYTEQ